ncbi:hypothetical protein [Gelatiniphilus marinus]|uniref:Uncharacterized protein n=1 Tax=Gelatiniphilus marinus TaxID=1759464 RepID=A0ABW5JQ96_9FLAO
MKTNIYTLLIVLLSFSFAYAQEHPVSDKTEPTASVINDAKPTVANPATFNIVNTTETKLEGNVLEENLAYSFSDIRIYLNRTRKVENIKWLFPKINKAKVA